MSGTLHWIMMRIRTILRKNDLTDARTNGVFARLIFVR